MRPCLILALLVAACHSLAQAGTWSRVGAILGPKGVAERDGALRIELARSDLQVQDSGGMLLAPEMGLLSRITFRGTETDSKVTGEICLVREEIDDVLDTLRVGGIEITALGNRLSGEQPSVYFLRFEGSGEGVRLANSVKRALGELAKDRPVSEGLRRAGQAPIVDWRAVSAALGQTVDQVGSSRVWRSIVDDGSWFTFGGCPCGRTLLLGNLQLPAGKLQDAIDSVRLKKMSVTAITRFGDKVEVAIQGEGDALRLAASVRSVIRSASAK